jgi:hypothetical protein
MMERTEIQVHGIDAKVLGEKSRSKEFLRIIRCNLHDERPVHRMWLHHCTPLGCTTGKPHQQKVQ